MARKSLVRRVSEKFNSGARKAALGLATLPVVLGVAGCDEDAVSAREPITEDVRSYGEDNGGSYRREFDQKSLIEELQGEYGTLYCYNKFDVRRGEDYLKKRIEDSKEGIQKTRNMGGDKFIKIEKDILRLGFIHRLSKQEFGDNFLLKNPRREDRKIVFDVEDLRDLEYPSLGIFRAEIVKEEGNNYLFLLVSNNERVTYFITEKRGENP